MGLPHPCLMLMTEPQSNLAAIVEQAVSGGVDVVLWRDLRAKIGKRDPVLVGMAAATSDRAILIAGGTWETSVRLGLRRVHLPERAAPVGVVKFRIGNGALVGKSVSSVETAVQAETAGADYVIVEHIFDPESEADSASSRLDLLRDVCAAVRVSVIAAGGITPANISLCIQSGAVGIAVSSSILEATHPRAVAEHYRVSLEAAWSERNQG